jgi:hypothetical protein
MYPRNISDQQPSADFRIDGQPKPILGEQELRALDLDNIFDATRLLEMLEATERGSDNLAN